MTGQKSPLHANYVLNFLRRNCYQIQSLPGKLSILALGAVLPTGLLFSANQSPNETSVQKGFPPVVESRIAFTTQTSLPKGVNEEWWSSVQGGLARHEYHPRQNDKGLQAPNRAHNLRTYFDSTGIRVQDRTATGSPELAALSLTDMGRGKSLEAVPAGTVHQTESRVEIRRPGVIEWYKNSAEGLEQGFTLLVRMKGNGPLVLELAVKGAKASLNGQSIDLATDAGRRLRYGKLVAQDANGCTLPSRFEVPSTNRLRLVVEDSKAAYPLVIDPMLTSIPDAFLESNQPDPPGVQPAAFGAWASSAGDVNGDGFDDVIVGAPGWESLLIHEGAAFVFLGGPTGIQGSDPATAHAQIDSLQEGAELGSAVSSAGDVNGDGFDDILVGAHFYESTIPDGQVTGAVFVFLGSANGIIATDESMADAWIQSDAISSNLGSAVSSAGDINGDGFDDIILGAPNYGVPFLEPGIPAFDLQGNAGAALIYLGGPQGIVSNGTPGFAGADAVIRPFQPGDRGLAGSVGATVSGAGDVNGDGFADVLIGAPGLPGTDPGAALVFLGSAAGIEGTDPSNAHAVIRSTPLIPNLGQAVSGAGDVNGDGFSDIVLGAPFATAGDPFIVQEGAVMVFLADSGGAGITATSTADAHTMFTGSIIAEWLGVRVAGVGDVDNDGFDDIAVAALQYPGNLDSEGIIHVFRGSPSGIIGTSLRDGTAVLLVPKGAVF